MSRKARVSSLYFVPIFSASFARYPSSSAAVASFTGFGGATFLIFAACSASK